ncbi:MAG TPA: signal peptidase II [Clostridia bacterium]|jgi:signal peptidase II|nr:signal peptidase II [Clostridiaceae bacterium]HOF26082.1 signal peptidase II [Clostridia bacterium]HOM34635.1 signal peptidase II [Clostridia bacterium]HOR89259.1 signal peptidase II [Clostridia bacterium]HOT70644.1 signal peptidase II [Clostridia bacterium]
MLRRINFKNILWLFLSIMIVAADQLSKFFIVSNMQLGDSIKIIDGFLYITHTRNTGAAWGIFGEHTEYLAIFSVVATIALIVLLLYIKRAFGAFSLALIIGGAVGNAIDRIRLGWVVDFIDAYIFGYDFPAFNVADSAITVGVFLLIIYMLFIHREMSP